MNRPQLTLLQSAGAWAYLIGTVLLAAPFGAAQGNVPPPAFETPHISTHDWTSTPGSPIDLDEVWADVKSPGDGRHYAVGTIHVTDTGPARSFSGQFVEWPAGLTALEAGFAGASPARQVVIVQCTNDAGAIMWQNYFYGVVPGLVGKAGTGNGRANNARSISVFPAVSPADTRVVICGETYDQIIPLSQVPPPGWLSSSATNPAGFIAVYDGNGVLRWTRHFFGRWIEGDCAVTDVSVRVVFNPSGTPIDDEVTYCGISTHGVDPAGGNFALTPVNWFTAPTGSPGFHDPAGGATDNGIGQWDGFVGRIRNAHASTVAPVAPLFHAVVGGREQDGLFGLAEITPQRFAVAGGSAISAPGPVPTPGLTFPFTWDPSSPQWFWSTETAYCVGVAAVFDAAATPGGAVVLEAADPMGLVLATRHSCARDVHVAFGGVLSGPAIPAGAPVLHFVGSTDDPDFLGILFLPPGPSPQPTIGGMTDGFLASAPGNVSPFVDFQAATFHGGTADDGLMGVGGWNEHPDHVAVFGFIKSSTPLISDFEIGSYFLMSGDTPGAVAPLQRLRRGQLLTNGVDQPNAMGDINATTTTTGLAYVEFGLDSPQGGGIGVDVRGRANVVGSTRATNYPVFGTGSRAFRGGVDAVRTAFDLVPPGVGRTDVTGLSLGPGFAPPAPANGGTTPFCALSPFGVQLGLPAPVLQRALIDWDGVRPSGGANVAVLVDRLPAGGITHSGVFQLGLPDTTPTPHLGCELWADNPTATFFTLPTPSGSLRFPLGTLPPSPFAGTAQVFLLMSVPWACNGQSAVATAGLYFSY